MLHTFPTCSLFGEPAAEELELEAEAAAEQEEEEKEGHASHPAPARHMTPPSRAQTRTPQSPG